MIRLIVKGTGREALRAAARRSIPVSIYGSDGRTTTILTTDMQNMRAVIEWFCEPGQAPFPLGTLLFYSASRR